MRRISYTIAATIIIFLSCMGYGLYNKSNYEDLNVDDSVIENYKVGILPDEVVDNVVNKIKSTYKDNKYILKVICESELEYSYSCATQQVKVEKVFNGQQELENTIINILMVTYIFQDMEAINIGFTGEMKVGREYLVLLDDVVSTPYMEAYIKRDDYLITSVFPYTEPYIEPHISEDEGENSIRYGIVKDEDFFVTSDEGADKLRELTHELTQVYK